MEQKIKLRPQKPFIRMSDDSSTEIKPRKRKVYPITSYGIIAFTIQNNSIKYLIYQRRDNYEYIEFVRGNWVSYEHLEKFFSLMSDEERERVRTHTHKQLWDDLWLDHNSRVYKEGYARAKSQYENIVKFIPKLLESTTTYMEECPWGFPKGKVNSGESFIDCGLREFEEETRIERKNLEIIKDSRYPYKDSKNPYVEYFEGSNNKTYCTYYYLAHMKNEIVPCQIDTPSFCIRKKTISPEAQDIKWITLEQSPLYLNKARVDILMNVETYIGKYIIPNMKK